MATTSQDNLIGQNLIEITRELDEESLMYCYFIYTNSSQSMLMINNPTLKSTHCIHHKINMPLICTLILLFQSFSQILGL